jgi:hypothetical protein
VHAIQSVLDLARYPGQIHRSLPLRRESYQEYDGSV